MPADNTLPTAVNLSCVRSNTAVRKGKAPNYRYYYEGKMESEEILDLVLQCPRGVFDNEPMRTDAVDCILDEILHEERTLGSCSLIGCLRIRADRLKTYGVGYEQELISRDGVSSAIRIADGEELLYAVMLWGLGMTPDDEGLCGWDRLRNAVAANEVCVRNKLRTMPCRISVEVRVGEVEPPRLTRSETIAAHLSATEAYRQKKAGQLTRSLYTWMPDTFLAYAQTDEGQLNNDAWLSAATVMDLLLNELDRRGRIPAVTRGVPSSGGSSRQQAAGHRMYISLTSVGRNLRSLPPEHAREADILCRTAETFIPMMAELWDLIEARIAAYFDSIPTDFIPRPGDLRSVCYKIGTYETDTPCRFRTPGALHRAGDLRVPRWMICAVWEAFTEFLEWHDDDLGGRLQWSVSPATLRAVVTAAPTPDATPATLYRPIEAVRIAALKHTSDDHLETARQAMRQVAWSALGTDGAGAQITNNK